MKKLCAIAIFLLYAGMAVALETPAWPPQVVDLFAMLPVQESGRIKPLDTVARFILLRLNGKRTLALENGDSRSAMEWMLDCLFVPKFADTCRCFTVESYDAIVALGVEPRGKKRDRYSYNDLRPGLDQLMELAQQASSTPKEEQSFIDAHMIALANNVLTYESLAHFFDFARARFNPEENALLGKGAPETGELHLSDVLDFLPKRLSELAASAQAMSEPEKEPIARGMRDFFGSLDTITEAARVFALIAPLNKEIKEWQTPAGLIEAAFDDQSEDKTSIEIVRLFELLADTSSDMVQFEKSLQALHDTLIARAALRDEYRRIPLEVKFYRGRYLFFSQWLFVLAFVLIACSWLQKTPGRLSLALNLSLVPPMLLLAVGITMRCLIRGRPPVTTLYETILFATFVAAMLGFCIEFVSRNRIAMSVAALFGAFGMFFAWRYEARDGTDTMPAVIAVLDTNFWLATHVTTIIIGYGAGLFASALGHVYLVSRSLGLKRQTPAFYNDLGRVIYGVLAFCLVFTLIGTVLGGVWASRSWGRFWGWDPKENGALLIILWALAVLHARRGGYIRANGLALSAIILGMIVVFAWWGVNALGVGLHSYGFTSGIWRTLAAFWIAETILMIAGLAVFRIFPACTDTT